MIDFSWCTDGKRNNAENRTELEKDKEHKEGTKRDA